VRLKEAGVLPEGLIVAAELGDVVTGQIHRRDIRRVHDSDEVESVKTSETLIPERSALAIGDVVTSVTTAARPRRRTAAPIGSGDGTRLDRGSRRLWFDLPHAAFRREDGKTRVLAFWDQRDTPGRAHARAATATGACSTARTSTEHLPRPTLTRRSPTARGKATHRVKAHTAHMSRG